MIQDPDQVHMGGNFIPNIKVPKTPARKKSSKTVRRKGSGGKGSKHKSQGGKRNKVAGNKRYVMHFWILDVDSHASKIYVSKNPANFFIQKIFLKYSPNLCMRTDLQT